MKIRRKKIRKSIFINNTVKWPIYRPRLVEFGRQMGQKGGQKEPPKNAL
jgi:hypothetical protein